MNRRALLRAVGAGSAVTVAGCLSDASSPISNDSSEDDGPLPDEDVESSGDDRVSVDPLAPHDGRMPTYGVTVDRVDVPPDDAPYAIDDLEPDARREFAAAVATGRYEAETAAITGSDAYLEPIAYGEYAFEAVTDVGTDQRGDDDWTDPVALQVSLDGKNLTVALRNVATEAIDVTVLGGPTFGPLLAQTDEVRVPLEHSEYADIDAITVDDGLIYADYSELRNRRESVTLSPDETLEDTYQVPGKTPSGAEVWLLVSYTGEEIGDRKSNWTLTIDPER